MLYLRNCLEGDQVGNINPQQKEERLVMSTFPTKLPWIKFLAPKSLLCLKNPPFSVNMNLLIIMSESSFVYCLCGCGFKIFTDEFNVF